MSLRANAHVWAPSLLLASLGLSECARVYHFIFTAVLHHDKAHRGLDHDHPSVPRARMQLAGAAAGLAAGAVSYAATVALLERALSATALDARRLFDAPPPQRAPLTLARAAAALSPRSATRGGVRAFFAAHGLQLMARGVAAGWAFLVLAPAAHAAAMGAFAHERTHEEQRASKWGREYRAATEEVVDFVDRLEQQGRERKGDAAAARVAAAAARPREDYAGFLEKRV